MQELSGVSFVRVLSLLGRPIHLPKTPAPNIITLGSVFTCEFSGNKYSPYTNSKLLKYNRGYLYMQNIKQITHSFCGYSNFPTCFWTYNICFWCIFCTMIWDLFLKQNIRIMFFLIKNKNTNSGEKNQVNTYELLTCSIPFTYKKKC